MLSGISVYNPNQNKNYKPSFGTGLQKYSDHVRFAIADAYQMKFGEKSLENFDSKTFIKKAIELFESKTASFDGKATLFSSNSLKELADSIKQKNIIILGDKEGLAMLKEAEKATGKAVNKSLLGVLYEAPDGNRIPSIVQFDASELIGKEGEPIIEPIIKTIGENFNKLFENGGIARKTDNTPYTFIKIPTDNPFARFSQSA